MPDRRCRALPSERRLSRDLPSLEGQSVRVAGHLEEYRALGGVAFAVVRDGAGSMQWTLKRGVTDPALFATLADLPRESVVEAVGTVRRSERAARGLELLPESVRVLARAEVPLPLGIVDKVPADLDTRLNHRVLDLRKPAVRAIFEFRAALLEGFRGAFVDRGFLEIETPKLLRQGAEGGATLFSVDYFGGPAFLAQSPQLYKQMLIGAGFERVFEIAPAFRAEPSDTVRHLSEFTSLDAEIGYVDSVEEILSALEGILADTLATARRRLERTGNPLAARVPPVEPPFPRIPFAVAEEWLGRPGAEQDFGTEDERRIGERVAAERGTPFYFLTEFPTRVKERTFYARRQDDDPRRTWYFDLDYRGTEIVSGGLREHRADRLMENLRSAGLDPAQFAGYLEAFRFGMPPHGGWGLGIDRLVMVLLGLENIREARLFPRDRYRLSP
ncbi:MAG: aspartate--tRNA(Asn) ligase [Thermoplasmata archaeon]